MLVFVLYGRDLKPGLGFTIFQIKCRFCDEAWQEQLNCAEAEWRKNFDQLRVEAFLLRLHLSLFSN